MKRDQPDSVASPLEDGFSPLQDGCGSHVEVHGIPSRPRARASIPGQSTSVQVGRVLVQSRWMFVSREPNKTSGLLKSGHSRTTDRPCTCRRTRTSGGCTSWSCASRRLHGGWRCICCSSRMDRAQLEGADGVGGEGGDGHMERLGSVFRQPRPHLRLSLEQNPAPSIVSHEQIDRLCPSSAKSALSLPCEETTRIHSWCRGVRRKTCSIVLNSISPTL